MLYDSDNPSNYVRFIERAKYLLNNFIITKQLEKDEAVERFNNYYSIKEKKVVNNKTVYENKKCKFNTIKYEKFRDYQVNAQKIYAIDKTLCATNNYQVLFITLTLDSSFHPFKAEELFDIMPESKDSIIDECEITNRMPNWSDFNYDKFKLFDLKAKIDSAYKHFNQKLSTFNTLLRKYTNDNYHFIQVFEPHKSLIPHIHGLLYIPNNVFSKVQQYIHNYFSKHFGMYDCKRLAVDSENGKCANYLLKYLEKTFSAPDNYLIGFYAISKMRAFRTSNVQRLGFKLNITDYKMIYKTLNKTKQGNQIKNELLGKAVSSKTNLYLELAKDVAIISDITKKPDDKNFCILKHKNLNTKLLKRKNELKNKFAYIKSTIKENVQTIDRIINDSINVQIYSEFARYKYASNTIKQQEFKFVCKKFDKNDCVYQDLYYLMDAHNTLEHYKNILQTDGEYKEYIDILNTISSNKSNNIYQIFYKDKLMYNSKDYQFIVHKKAFYKKFEYSPAPSGRLFKNMYKAYIPKETNQRIEKEIKQARAKEIEQCEAIGIKAYNVIEYQSKVIDKNPDYANSKIFQDLIKNHNLEYKNGGFNFIVCNDF